jgi:hypothetical protein
MRASKRKLLGRPPLRSLDAGENARMKLSDVLEWFIAQIENANARQRYLRSKKVLLEYFGDPRITNLNGFAIDGLRTPAHIRG